MNSQLHSLIVAAVITASGVACQANAASDSDAACDGLVTHARSVSPGAWRQGVEEALAPFLTIEKERNPAINNSSDDTFGRSLVDLPWVRQALDDETGNWSEFVSRMPGQDIYMVSTYQGTLECQGVVFIQAPAGSNPKSIPGPTGFDGGDCWTQSGKLGTVNGRPAFIEGGAENDHTFDTGYKIVPWTGTGWAQGCKLSLRFQSIFDLASRHCGDAKVCRAAEPIAPKLAKAYDGFRRTFNGGSQTAFVFDRGQEAQAALKRLTENSAFPKDIPEFPRFGDKDQTSYGGSYSYSGFQFLPLRIAGQWRLAAVGHEGVGWRETDRTLIAIFDENGGTLTPKASFEVQAVNAGLIEARSEAAF